MHAALDLFCNCVYDTKFFFDVFSSSICLKYVSEIKIRQKSCKICFFRLQNTRICLQKCPPFRAAKLTRDI